MSYVAAVSLCAVLFSEDDSTDDVNYKRLVCLQDDLTVLSVEDGAVGVDMDAWSDQ